MTPDNYFGFKKDWW